MTAREEFRAAWTLCRVFMGVVDQCSPCEMDLGALHVIPRGSHALGAYIDREAPEPLTSHRRDFPWEIRRDLRRLREVRAWRAMSRASRKAGAEMAAFAVSCEAASEALTIAAWRGADRAMFGR